MSDFDFPDDDLLCPIGSDDPLKNSSNVDADVAGNWAVKIEINF